MTTEIQQNRYDQLLRRVGGLIGPGAKVSEVLSELFPTIDVENVPGELLILMGTRICFGGGVTIATAGQAGKCQLFNPDDSGMLVTITRVVASTGSASIFRWGRSNVSFANPVGVSTFRDFRNPITNFPVAEVHSQVAVALATATNQVRIAGLVQFLLEPPNGICILPPGSGFELGAATTNTSFNFGFDWRERVAEPSELNL